MLQNFIFIISVGLSSPAAETPERNPENISEAGSDGETFLWLGEDGSPASEGGTAKSGFRLRARKGLIKLGDNLADLTVPEGLFYLSPEDAGIFLTEVWGNPPGKLGLGMLLPSDIAPNSAEAWGVVLDYDDVGHVSDVDAQQIDYDKLLKEKQSMLSRENKKRKKSGYDDLNLLGWASQPRYDAQTRTLHWAEELKSGDESAHILNYFVRVLGRDGYLVLNAVANASDLESVSRRMQTLISDVSFTPNERYEAFDPSTGRVAVAGLAALVGGKVAAKAGLLGLIGAAGKKGIVVLVVAITSLVSRLFARRKENTGALDPPVAATGKSERAQR